MSSVFSPLIENAIRLACYWHASQFRSDAEAQAFAHLTAVAMILSRAGFEETVIAAGFCHDLLEDTQCPPEEISKACNAQVLQIVRTVTLNPEFDFKTQWQAQQEAYIEAVRQGSVEAKAVCTANKVHNLEILITTLEAYGLAFFRYSKEVPEQRLWLEDQVCLMLQASWKHPLVTEYDLVLDQFVHLLETLEREEKAGISRKPLPQSEPALHPIEEIVDDSINALESIFPFRDKTEAEPEPLPIPNLTVEPHSSRIKMTTVDSLKYLSKEEFRLLLPVAIRLGIDKQGLTNLVLQEAMGINYLTAYRILKELKRLHIIKRADSPKPRKIIVARAKEVLKELKKE